MKRHAAMPLVVGLFYAAAVPLAVAGDAKEEAIKKDRMKYEGTWQVVSLEVDGNKSDEQDAKKITVVNDVDGKWRLEVDGKVIARGTSEIDPTKKPKAVDLTETEGDDKGKTALGIYEVGDDERKVCYAKPGMERPDDFSAPAGSGRILAVLKRLKK
jgi:uncharacterized protein (TIGR03067 family)